MALTPETIHAAADQIAETGKQPTLAAVRNALGGGSFTTISEAMKAWRAARQASPMPLQEQAPAAVTDRLGGMASEIWSIALSMATDRLQAERSALSQAREAMEQQLQEAVELADQVAAELDDAREIIAQQEKALARAKQQVDELAKTKEAANLAQAALVESQKRADGLVVFWEEERQTARSAQEKAELAIAEAARLKGKLEAMESATGSRANKKISH